MKNRTFRRIKDMAKPYYKSIIIVSILSLLVSIGEIARPYIIKIVIDDYLSKGLYNVGIMTIGMLGAIYIAIVIVGNIISFISETAINIVGENVVYDLRNKLYKYTQYANISFHDRTPAGKLFVSITSDVEDISKLFKEVIATFIKDVILIITLVGIMIYISYKLSIMAFIVLPLVIISSFFLTRLSNKILSKAKTIRARMYSFLAESIYGAKAIKIFNIQREKKEECETWTKKHRDSMSGKRGCNSNSFRFNNSA